MRSSGAAVEGGGGAHMGHGAALEARQLVVSVGVGCGGGWNERDGSDTGV